MQNKIRPDDLTTEWLDEIAMNRIRKNRNTSPQIQQPRQIIQESNRKTPHPILDQPVSKFRNNNAQTKQIKLLDGETLNTVNENIKKARLRAEATYMRAPHMVSPLYAPGSKILREQGADALSLRNLSNSVSVNTDMDNLSSRINSTILQKFGAGDSQESLLQQMNGSMRAEVSHKMKLLQQGQWVAPNTLLPQLQQNSPQICKVIPGYFAFHQIHTQGFGSNILLVRAVGQISPQFMNIDFIIRESIRAYVVKPNEDRIDMNTIQNNPQILSELVLLEAPPMSGIGRILVQKEAIANGMGGGRQVLTDRVIRTMAPNQQFLHQNNQKILTNNQKILTNNQQHVVQNNNGKKFLKG